MVKMEAWIQELSRKLTLVQDTRPVYRTLDSLVPPMGRKELAEAGQAGE